MRGLLKKRGEVELEEVDLTMQSAMRSTRWNLKRRKRGVLVSAYPTRARCPCAPIRCIWNRSS